MHQNCASSIGFQVVPMPKAAARLPDSKKRKSQTRQYDVSRDQKQKCGRL